MKRILLILTILLSSLAVSGQGMIDSLSVFFRQGASTWDPTYMGNGGRMDEFVERVKSLQEGNKYYLVSISYEAKASPEGPYEVNQRLAAERAAAIREHLSHVISFSEPLSDLLVFNEDYMRLAVMVEESSMPGKAKVLDVLREIRYVSDPTAELANRVKRELMAIDGGRAWNYIYENFFPQLRRFHIVVRIGANKQSMTLVATRALIDQSVAEHEVPRFEPVPVETWQRSLYIKSNAIGWGFLVANLAVEVDLSQKLSLNFPIYYSGADYFSSRRKLRMFGCYPELRYWFKGVESDGFFVGAHFGCALYNYALEGKWRIQDHSGESPALGGGVNAGYRMGLGKTNRWIVEFTLGAGVYDLHYDKFYNVDNGLRAEKDIHRTMFMIDHVGVSFGYRFNLNKKNR